VTTGSPNQKATISIDTTRTIGTIDPMIFGQYLEHVQPEDKCIYGAIVDEPSELTDGEGFRVDVIEAVQELAVPVVRWPGGCFADIYHWEDGIGPKDRRPVRRNWHWGGLEPNTFGTDEFLNWCERVGTQPYLNLNFGTGTLDEAIRWLDYTNGTELTTDVRRRHENGHPEPYNVTFWGIGNEQWGHWEAGHMDARTYAAQLHNWAQFMKKLDPSIQPIGIGSPAARDPEWDLEVISKAGHLIDFLTLHIYGHALNRRDDYYNVVSLPIYVEERIRTMASVIAAGSQRIGRDSPITISIDEWNIRHLVEDEDGGPPKLKRLSPRTIRDAIAAAGVFHAMIRQCNNVTMANYVFLLNGNGVLLVDDQGIVKTPLYHLFHMYRNLMPSEALGVDVLSKARTTGVRMDDPAATETRAMPFIDAVASQHVDGSSLTVAIINRHLEEDIDVDIVTSGGEAGGSVAVRTLTHADPLATNDRQQAEQIIPDTSSCEWTGTFTAPAHSVSLLTFS
jgi:alpha-N-arabinofuranosidase